MKEDKLKTLLDKYWDGKTSLEEEAEIRHLLKNTEDWNEEKQFFKGIEQLNSLEGNPIRLSNSLKSSWKQHLPYAAVFVFILISGWLAMTTYQSNQEREAYMEVMQAFDLIQENMQKGTSQIEIMGEFKHLNTTHELFNIEEIK